MYKIGTNNNERCRRLCRSHELFAGVACMFTFAHTIESRFLKLFNLLIMSESKKRKNYVYSGGTNCSVANCTNTTKKMKEQTRVVQFYKFPNTKYESIRRPAWIRFCARKK